MTNVEKLTEIEASVRRCEAMVTSMDGSLGWIETDLAALQGSVPRLPRTLPLLWLALAASVAC